MSRATADDQVRFLLSCIKFCNNGKIDFVEVAKECNVVSKGAAAKRYERLQKSVGYHVNGTTSAEKSTSDVPQRSKKTNKIEPGQKRKRGDLLYDDPFIDTCKREGDEEIKARPQLKREKVDPPRMQDLHMLHRGPAYNPYMQPHPSYAHGAMSHYIHPNMHPTPHFPVMPPQHTAYGHLPDIGPNHQFMMPQQALQTYSIPQTVQPSPSHSANTTSPRYNDACHTESLNSTHPDPAAFQNHLQLENGVPSAFSLPTSSVATEPHASTHMMYPHSSTKQECDSSPLPESFVDFLAAEIKFEKEEVKEDQTDHLSPTDLPEASNGNGNDPICNTKECKDNSNLKQVLITSDAQCNIKEEEGSKYLNECILISD